MNLNNQITEESIKKYSLNIINFIPDKRYKILRYHLYLFNYLKCNKYFFFKKNYSIIDLSQYFKK